MLCKKLIEFHKEASAIFGCLAEPCKEHIKILEEMRRCVGLFPFFSVCIDNHPLPPRDCLDDPNYKEYLINEFNTYAPMVKETLDTAIKKIEDKYFEVYDLPLHGYDSANTPKRFVITPSYYEALSGRLEYDAGAYDKFNLVTTWAYSDTKEVMTVTLMLKLIKKTVKHFHHCNDIVNRISHCVDLLLTDSSSTETKVVEPPKSEDDTNVSMDVEIEECKYSDMK